MSGHSKFANIKHKKEKNDAKKGKIFTVIGREIVIAVKEGGPDPNNNSKLRDVIAKAKANNMPNDTIDRGIKKAAGDSNADNYERITYEGYGPSGVAIIVETLTDNKNRTAGKLSPAAELCGAVNTIVNENGVLTGHITDGIGFMQALKDNDIDVIGKKMTIAGAGGAATAIEIQAALDGVKEISIFNIHDKFWANAEETVKKINERTNCKATLYDLDDKEKLREEMADSYIFVNGTGVGMKPLEGMSIVPDKSFFRPELIVVDVPYSPLETTMRKMAKEVGCKTMNGLGMMLFQGAAAFKLWTGKDMPIEHMKEVLNIRYDD